MVRAAVAVLVGLLVLAAGLVLRRSTETVAEVLAFGGVVIACIGVWQLVTRFLQSRED